MAALPACSTRRRPEASKAPLVLGDGALQVLIDGAWSRRERWQPFQSVLSLANTDNGQIGRLPELLRRYDNVRLRILRTIVDTTPNGYRAGDARFLIGWIWQTITDSRRADILYRRALSMIRQSDAATQS